MVSKQQRVAGHAAQRPTVDELLASRERMNQAGADFLKVDLETALTFVKIARNTSDRARRGRSATAAKKAYDTILKLVDKIELSTHDERILTRGLRKLRSELEKAGIAS